MIDPWLECNPFRIQPDGDVQHPSQSAAQPTGVRRADRYQASPTQSRHVVTG
jgi:hypothetical protein